MKRLILFLFLLSLSFAAHRSPCELFLQGLQTSLSEAVSEAANCTVLTELSSFWNNVFLTNSTQAIENIQDQDLTAFYKALSEEDYYTLGTQASQLKGFSDDFEVWIRGFTGKWGALDGFWTWQKQPTARDFDTDWNEQKLLFFSQDGAAIQRFDPALGSSYASQIGYSYNHWGLLGSQLVQANNERLFIFDSPDLTSSLDKPKRTIPYDSTISKLSVFSLKAAGQLEIKSNDFIFLHFRNKGEGCIISPDDESKKLCFLLQKTIASSIVVRVEGKDKTGKWQYKNFLVICNYQGVVELISFPDNLQQLEKRQIITDKPREISVLDNLYFIRTNREFFLFFNTGEEVFSYDLASNLESTTAKRDWNKIVGEKEIHKMTFFANPISLKTQPPESSQDYLSIAVKDKDDNLNFHLFGLSTLRIETAKYIESIKLDGTVQIFSIQYSLQKTKNTKEGDPLLFLAAYEWKVFGRDILHLYQAEWDFFKQMYRWIELDNGKNLGHIPQAKSLFTFPEEVKSAQNPNLQHNLLRIGVEGFSNYAYTSKKLYSSHRNEVLSTTPLFGQSLYWKQATVNNVDDWYLPGGIQYSNWCWASVASTIYNFNRRNVAVEQLTQCVLASKVLQKPQCCDVPRPAECNVTGQAALSLRDHYDFIRIRMGDPNTIPKSNFFSFARVKAEIDNNRLMTATLDGDM